MNQWGSFFSHLGSALKKYISKQAARLYKSCGALRKEFLLMERYPAYFEDDVYYPQIEVDEPSLTLPDIDIEYLMKQALAISAEIELESLLKKIMNVVIESSGAQSGYLIMEEKDGLFIHAESHANIKNNVQISKKKLENSDNICKTIVRYVQRTGERLILDNASKKGGFKDNKEVQDMKLRSVLCMPVLKHSKVIGILYLENRLANSVFTPEKTVLLELLISQAAISIENATLFVKREKQRKIEKTLEELQRSNKELQQFAYIASHDLQEPLRMISSFLQLLQRRYEGQLDSDADEFIEFAVDGAARMQELINDLLAYSRVNRTTSAFETVDLDKVLDEVLMYHKLSIKENDVDITRDGLPTVNGDYSQMVQVFQNLIGNAIKYRDNKTPNIHISAEKEDENWLFKVEDNGIGIDPKYFDRVFLIFKRLHTNDEYSGTGIGLAITKRIIERHGGDIWGGFPAGNGFEILF
jgi:Bacteriophytochrome (light-regulated signal transduction histidine kinase)